MDLPSLLALAPQRLVNFRATRYRGDEACCQLAEFETGDATTIQDLYRFLRERFALFQKNQPNEALLTRFLETTSPASFRELVQRIRHLGVASFQQRPFPKLARTIHDVRGGGLTSLIGHLDLILHRDNSVDARRVLFPLVRDHLKIMRNSVADLDPEGRQRDQLHKAHTVDELLDAWRHASFGSAEKAIEIKVRCEFRGIVSESCLENAALDRVLYNLINNAAHHCAEGPIEVILAPVPEDGLASDLRVVVTNSVSPAAAERLQELTALTGGPRALFQAGVSTTGSGLGLAITSGFVAEAYGLAGWLDAVEGGYVGAILREDRFVAWFHWPISIEEFEGGEAPDRRADL